MDRSEYLKAWRQANKEKNREYQRKWKSENRASARAAYKASAAAKPEEYKARTATWKANNRGRVLGHNAARRAAQVSATPPWSDLDAIASVYSECIAVTARTGIKHQVDHVVPLIHPLVCGLHVPHNLQILTAKENRAKSNRFEVS